MENVAIEVDGNTTTTTSGSSEHEGTNIATGVYATTVEQLAASPKLSRRTQEEVVSGNQVSSEDPDNYPLNSPWCFWFDR